jgi:hypothetical protein
MIERISLGLLLENLILTILRHLSSYRTLLTRYIPLANTNHTIYGDVDTCGIARSITQRVHVSATQLLDSRQTRHAAVVLQLLLPVGLLFHAVCHRRLNETW